MDIVTVATGVLIVVVIGFIYNRVKNGNNANPKPGTGNGSPSRPTRPKQHIK